MKRYNPSEVEPKWQKIWAETKLYQVTEDKTKAKKYVAGMFPYPSGAGLHVGHVRNYSIVDVIARFHRQQGYNVLNPIGWDTFGLPAENYAIKTGTPPAVSTEQNIKNFKNQFLRLGMSIDWSREINTSDPEYYRWTQWLFIKLFEKGLAYQAERQQWWCPVDKTVLANEQVEAGKCWRCGSQVIKKSMKQWFFKITDYADELLDDIDQLDWPEGIKAMQRNWIGRSIGVEVDFKLDFGGDKRNQTIDPEGKKSLLKVFTTRVDTIFGATYLVLAPEHIWLQLALKHGSVIANNQEVADYVAQAAKKSDLERQVEQKDKTGIKLDGVNAINPLTGEQIPVFVADYVLTGYGTGAVMAVPAHDERDYQFAQKFNLPIKPVIEANDKQAEFYSGEGKLIDSDNYTGQASSQAREQITADLAQKQQAQEKVNYRMNDWLISRQRYWGAPIPIVHCEKDGAVAVPESELPVVLPEVSQYEPDGSGKGVLSRAEDWVNATCPKCGGPAKRETDVMDGYACSSWYYLRYADPNNKSRAWDPDKADYWTPIDYYCGGDHAVSHLLYSRFWTKAFADMGLIKTREPVKNLVFNGYINAPDGRKMSKSKGNTVDPLELVDQGYGADALRLYELFIAPYELDAAWDPNGIAGTHRFLNRVWNLVQEYKISEATAKAPIPSVHLAIKKVTQDLERLSFNTAIAAQMELVNEFYKNKDSGMNDPSWKFALTSLLQLLAPFAPHVAEELWQQLGQEESVHLAIWPTWDNKYLHDAASRVAVQVNGKVRSELLVSKDLSQDDVEQMALADPSVQTHLQGKVPSRIIYVPGRILNLVIK